ncbi:hypothetical protein DYB37_013972, partial [Aphanomyces astaci]
FVVARENNLLPTTNSILSEDEQVDAELQCILDSKFSAEGAALTNPDATFDWRNQFALLSNDEFKKYVAVSFGRGSRYAGGRDRVVAGDVQGLDHTGRRGAGKQREHAPSSAHCIKTGTFLKLAEQQVTSCSMNGGSQGCNGGWPLYAIHYTASGLCLSSAYPYTSGSTGQTGACKSCTKQALAIGSSVRVSGGAGVKIALAK